MRLHHKRKLKSYYLLFILAFMPFTFVKGQGSAEEVTRRKCGHKEYVEYLTNKDSSFADRRNDIEEQMEQWLKKNPTAASNGKIIYTIPVVFHVLYYVNAHNIPYSRIVEQIDVLNKDFRKLNADISKTPTAFKSRVADVEFQFCLAERDPQGNWTNGVTRKEVTKASYGYYDDDDIKYSSRGGVDAWDPKKYLNIWVANLTGGVLGYSQPPGGPLATDGVVIGFKYVGTNGASPPFNKGRTATHEIGHWFNLIHIWGDDDGACWGSDLVDDTPNQASEFYGEPVFPQMDKCTPDSPGVMFMNYMDYVDDAAMVMFTNGQKARMIAALNVYRSALKTSDGCEPATSIYEVPEIFDFTVYPNPSNGLFNMELMLNRSSRVEIAVTDITGKSVYTQSEDIIADFTGQIDLRHLSKGIYFLKLNTEEQTITRRLVIGGGN